MNTTDRSGEIVSTARVSFRPENRKELYLTICSLIVRIRSEAGCRTYRLYEDAGDQEVAGDQNAFILIGEWETRDDWSRHLTSQNFAVLIGSLRLLGNRPQVDFKLLTHLPSIEAVTRARCEPQTAALNLY